MRSDGRDNWATPESVYKQICECWGVYPQVDLFCDRANLRCPYGFTFPEVDAFSFSPGNDIF